MIRRRRLGGPAQALKIVVTGPFAAGKTSLIQTISEVTVLGTERPLGKERSSEKTTTTVAMDFGRISFPAGEDGHEVCLFLFGTPGQQRFEVMWEVLSQGMIGFVVLVDASDERSAEEAGRVLETFRAYADVPFVVGVTHLDDAPDPGGTLEEIQARLGLDSPPLACDPRSREDVKAVMLDILFGVMGRLEAVGARG